VFPPGEFIRDEILARGLTERGFQVLLFATGCTSVQVVACELAAYVDDKRLVIDPDTAACLGRAFDVSPEYFINLDRAWRGVDTEEVTK
jgi:plasmid maintenance system antidote protein VapI